MGWVPCWGQGLVLVQGVQELQAEVMVRPAWGQEEGEEEAREGILPSGLEVELLGPGILGPQLDGGLAVAVPVPVPAAVTELHSAAGPVQQDSH